jgi:glycosyltransferase involved in cell wall biosynthesis
MYVHIIENKKYFIYPASFWPHKNHIRLIKAFKTFSERNDDFKLVLTGDCEVTNLLNPFLGQEYILLLYQDSVGLWNVSFDAKFILKQQYIPQEANTLSVFRFIYDGTNFIQLGN